MRKDTKEFIYLLLDFIDVLTKSSNPNALFKIDHNQLMEIKDELFLLMHDDSEKISSDEGKLIPNLIGTLPFILVDRNKFPTNNDIVKFAEFGDRLQRGESYFVFIAGISMHYIPFCFFRHSNLLK